MQVDNLTKGLVLAQNVESATSLLARARGLLGHAPLRLGEGLLITPCRSIHTWFMAFPIDVAFLDNRYRVVHTIHSMAPGRVSPHLFSAKSVLELAGGALAKSGTEVGDVLAMRD